MDNVNLKIYLPVMVGSFVLGGILGYYSMPTKTKIVTEVKTEVKTVKENVVIDRIITKVVKPDGTITEITTEKDRSQIDSDSKSTSSIKTVEVINAKHLSLGVSYKGSVYDFENILDYRNNLGVSMEYDTGFLSTYVGGSVFGDTTVILTIGVRL